MIERSNHTRQFLDRLEAFRRAGAAHVGTARTDPADGREYLDLVQMELVYVDADGNVVGSEANDYRPRPGELAAVKLS